jgi:hypothetical protein
MPIQISNPDLRIFNMHLRMPFKYGIATLRALPHLFMRLDLEIDGVTKSGISADHLPPKWFTKNPATHARDDIADMIDCIRAAVAHAQAAGQCANIFELWLKTYTAQKAWAAAKSYPPLLWNFGVALVERAMLEAFNKHLNITFPQALRENRIRLDLGQIYREQVDSEATFGADMQKQPRNWRRTDTDQMLRAFFQEPLKKIIARHTVGLADPLTNGDIPANEKLNDGLPQSLEDCIKAYGLTHFKIKLSGDVDHDLARVRALAKLIPPLTKNHFAFTLDGNENFKQIDPFQQLWRTLGSDANLKSFISKSLFVEQPLHRDVALSDETKNAHAKWTDRPPMIIDESDATFASLPRALECGYVGTSHKNCKGIIKGIANACLLRQRPGQILSGEDLSNVGPVALLQDLAVCASLGINHVERNGHHYFRGLSMFPQEVQDRILRHHSDLYTQHESGFPTVKISHGLMSSSSTIACPLGLNFDPDISSFTPIDQWSFESLGISD